MRGDWQLAEHLYVRRIRGRPPQSEDRFLAEALGVVPRWRFTLASRILGVDLRSLLYRLGFRALVLNELERFNPKKVKDATHRVQ